MNLVDEVDIDNLIREAASSLDDPDKLSDFIREKTTIAIERFLVSVLLHTYSAFNER